MTTKEQLTMIMTFAFDIETKYLKVSETVNHHNSPFITNQFEINIINYIINIILEF